MARQQRKSAKPLVASPSATRFWVEHIIEEVKRLAKAHAAGEGVAIATPEIECADEPTKLYQEAVAEVGEHLPDLRRAVIEARAARHDLFHAVRQADDPSGNDDPGLLFIGASSRWRRALHELLPQLSALDSQKHKADEQEGRAAATSRGATTVEEEALPPLTPEEAAILKVLLQANGVTMIVEKIMGKVRFTDKTIRTSLKHLRTSVLELVEEPKPKKGFCLTAKGKKRAMELPPDAGADLFNPTRPGR